MKTAKEIEKEIKRLKADIEHYKIGKEAIAYADNKPEEKKYYDLAVDLQERKLTVLQWVMGEDVFI